MYAHEYQDKFMDLGLYQTSLSIFCGFIKTKNAKILDVACGPGNTAKFLASTRQDFEISGIDLSERMIDLARTNNPDAAFRVFDCRNILQLNQQYDGIICAFGLPYLYKAEAIKFIENCSNLLKSNGVLYISTMEDEYQKSGFVAPSSGKGEQVLYINYHESEYLLKTLESHHFKVLDISRQTFTYENGKTNNDLIIIAQLNSPT